MPEKTLAAEVDPDFKQAVRMAAASNGISMSEYVRIAVREKLQEDDEGNSQERTVAAVS